MEMLRKTRLAAGALSAFALAFTLMGCQDSSKSDDVAKSDAQKDNASAQNVLQQAANEISKDSKVAAGAIDDTTITTKVKAAIVAEPALHDTTIRVATVDGVVTLSGATSDQKKIDKAQELAQTVDGVKSVNNELVVKTPS